MEKLLSTTEAARLLGVPPSRLARWRREGRGPAWVRVGRHPRYNPEDFRSWVAAQTVGTPRPVDFGVSLPVAVATDTVPSDPRAG